jgi:hypothetical protein
MRATSFVLAIALLAGGAAVAHAEARNELAIGSNARALRSDSANALTSDGLASGQLTYARGLGFAPRGAELWVEGGLGWGNVTGKMFQSLTTDVSTLAFTAGARAHYPLHRLLAVTARVDLGTARTTLKLSDSSARTASDRGWGGVIEAAGGVDLYLVNSPRFALGMRLELGYVAATPVGLSPTTDRSDSTTLTLMMTGASLGHLNLSGPAVGFAVVSQF